MNLVRREDSAKVGKLIGAIMVVFVCAGWRVVSVTQEDRPAAVQGQNVVFAATPGVERTQTDTNAPIEVPDTVVSMDVDPFRPLRVSTSDSTTKSAPPDTTPRAVISRPIAPLPALVPPLRETLPPASVSVESVESSRLRLTGIVSGPHPTAVIDAGSGEVVVRKGSHLRDGSLVVGIEPTSVTLRRGDKRIALSLFE